MADAIEFVNLHQHSDYSLLDGFGKPIDIARKTHELGQTAAAITDHGNMGGAIVFSDACRKEGIKPIIGTELYVTRGSRFDRPKRDDEYGETYHLIALALNETGYRNLMRINSTSHLDSFFHDPRVDHDLLAQYGEGLYILSGCLGSELSQGIVTGDENQVRETLDFYASTFPGRYALEIQNHGIDDENLAREQIIQLAKRYNLPLVATVDNHFVEPEQSAIHELWLAVQTGAKMSQEKRFKFSGSGYHITSGADMLKLFPDHPEALSNSLMIAEMCQFQLPESTLHLPKYHGLQPGQTSDDLLRQLCLQGLARKYPEATDEVRDRLNMELQVITGAGFSDYFLIVWDLVHHAGDVGVKVGPGRGSAAGSIVSYLLDITALDPIKYNLLFERFLNPERVSMPDIDIDFDNRDKMIEYARRAYGEDRVVQIATYGAMGAKEACRRVATAREIPFADQLALTRLIPDGPLDESLRTDKDLIEFVRDNPWTHDVIREAQEVYGHISKIGMHAAGVVIADQDIQDLTPLRHPQGKEHPDAVITQFDLSDLNQLQLLKVDFLGLENLTILDSALTMVAQTYGRRVANTNIPMDDLATMEMLSRGDTVGVFQMEGSGIRGLLMELQPRTLGDLAAATALFRPGPLQGVVDPETGEKVVQAYIGRRHGKRPVAYPCPEVEPILRESYGLIVYQDQVMQIAHDLAGYSLGEADILRAAMGKKDPEKMEHERVKFFAGATANGIDEEGVEQLWNFMEKFAGYGFNKAHATAYALLAYYTAYVKCHYPLEYMTALCTSRGGVFDVNKGTDAKAKRGTIEDAIRDAQARGITVTNPDVNHSLADFSIRPRQTINYGLSHIKGVGELPAQCIVEERERNGPYETLEELVERNQVRGLSLRAAQALWGKGKETALSLEELREQGLVKDEEVAIAEKIIAERAVAPYKSFADMVNRNDLKTGINKTTLTSLVASGACDYFGSRKELMTMIPEVLKNVPKMRTGAGMQMSIPTDAKKRSTSHANKKVLTLKDLDAEEAVLGMALSGHRMDLYQNELKKKGVKTCQEVSATPNLPPRFLTAGVVKSKRFTKTRKDNKPMAILRLEDQTGAFDVMCFSDMLPELKDVLENGSGPLLVRGYRMNSRGRSDDDLTIVAQAVSRLVDTPEVEVAKPVEAAPEVAVEAELSLV